MCCDGASKRRSELIPNPSAGKISEEFPLSKIKLRESPPPPPNESFPENPPRVDKISGSSRTHTNN